MFRLYKYNSGNLERIDTGRVKLQTSASVYGFMSAMKKKFPKEFSNEQQVVIVHYIQGVGEKIVGIYENTWNKYDRTTTLESEIRAYLASAVNYYDLSIRDLNMGNVSNIFGNLGWRILSREMVNESCLLSTSEVIRYTFTKDDKNFNVEVVIDIVKGKFFLHRKQI